MRLAFFGTPQVAADILADLLAAKSEIVTVVTQPDQPKGRGRKLGCPPVKEYALKDKGIIVLQPEKLKENAEFTETFRRLKPDLGIVVAYGKIIPQEILDIPKHGFINLHASMLPKYRGAAPIQWALLRGETETGMTIFKLVEDLDAGPIILQKKVTIDEDDNALTLSTKLFSTGRELLREALAFFDQGRVCFTEQKESEATVAPALTKESGEIDWRQPAKDIHNRIRALVEWPTAHTFVHQKRLKLLVSRRHATDLTTGERLPGQIVALIKQVGFVVATGAGNLLVNEVQPEGGKRMGGYNFVIGHDVKIGETLPN